MNNHAQMLGVMAGCLLQSAATAEPAPEVAALVAALKLEPHVEGGYFRRTFQADQRAQIDTANGPRYTLTSIYYLLTADSPVGHWHLNRSDIIHFFHLGGPLEYNVIHPDGTLETVVLGPDVAAGQRLQFTVRGGSWKSSRLLEGGAFGLISEAVAPGFDYADMTLGSAATLTEQFPRHRALIERYARQP